MTDNPQTTLLTDAEASALPPMNDEREALEELLRLGLAAIDEACGTDGSDYDHRQFRDALSEWSDDTLWRLLRRVKL